ncbi:MAG TPA: hypothetical protein PLE45_01240 [Spirochaetota bacterium]|nr:hypothetical protein [Spirochaetota bacterium]HOL56126.1 hypothetical protein [Spirochaetota bacterium]HPP03376.1 hypothetical protein [Spirochaetota bacterium]
MDVIFIDISIREHRLSFLLNRFFERFNELKNFVIKEFSIVSFDEKNEKVLIYKNKREAIIIDKDVKDAFIFIIENIVNKKDLRLNSKYELIKIGRDIGLDFDVLFKIVGWFQGQKGIDYFYSIENFSELLRNLTLNERLGINEAFNFYKIVFHKVDLFLERLPSNLTFSEMSRSIQYITEIYNKIKDENSIISRLDFSSKDRFLNSLVNIRYEKYSYYKEKFDNYIKKFNFPKGVRINYDPNFENEAYQLIIDFNSREKLLQKIEAIENSLKREKDSKDLFIMENLFE